MDTVRLLVVDDDRGNCTLVSKFLTDRGYRVDTAYDGNRAIQLAEQNTYNLAVLDYQMPGIDGVETYKRIREIQPGMVGIFVTAFTTLDTVYPAIAAGVERVLPKPVQLDELLGLVETMAGKPESTRI